MPVNIRWRASATGTREESQVIHRRSHFSAHQAVVREPQVGSRTRSLGSGAISKQCSTTLGLVWTTHICHTCRIVPHVFGLQTAPEPFQVQPSFEFVFRNQRVDRKQAQ